MKNRSIKKAVANATAKISMERASGVEPPSEAWEAAILPINYARDIKFLLRKVQIRCNTLKGREFDRPQSLVLSGLPDLALKIEYRLGKLAFYQ